MSTRSIIGMEQADGKIKTVYCHWDGYPFRNGKKLLEHYTDPAKIEKLLKQGDISSLREEIGKKHAFSGDDNPTWTVFYKRDRGEKGVNAITYENEKEFWSAMADSWCEYFYLFRDGKWFYSAEYDNGSFHELTEEVCENA